MIGILYINQIRLEILDPRRKDLQPPQLEPWLLSLIHSQSPHSAQIISIFRRESIVVNKVAATIDDEFGFVTLDALDVVG